MRTPNGSHGILALDQPAQEHVDHSLNFVNIRNGLKGLSAGKLASSTLDTLKPEFLQRRKPAGRRPLSSTAWLDGLRGWAALGVCFVHLTVYTHPKIELCYGAEIEPGVYNKTPAALPFIRILFTGGHLAVMIFFIISGYVLTRRMISLLHEGRREDFVSAVHSAICRRPLRLYLPVVWSTLALVFIWHVFGIATPWPDRQPTIFSELVTWCKDIMKFSFFYRNGFLFTYYNIHTWTIPVELRGSMFIFVWLFALHQFTNRLRILLTFAMTIYLAVGCAGAWYAAFFAGMLTAELDLLAAEDNAIQIKLPWNGFLKALKRRPKILATLLHAMLFCGLFLGSEPSGDYIEKEEILGSCPGWKTLSKMIPAAYNASYRGEWESTHRWFWLFWASWMLLVSIKGIRWVRSIFESRFSQYLGTHSFALYLIHGPTIGLLSERLFYLTGVKAPADPDAAAKFGHLLNRWRDAPWWPFPATPSTTTSPTTTSTTSSGGSAPRGLEPNFLVCALISMLVFLYVAELGTRLFDRPSVRVSRWVFGVLNKVDR